MTSDSLKVGRADLNALYHVIGGEQGLTQILNEFYSRLSTDAMIGYFFSGKDLHHIASMQKSFLMKAMGINSEYHGKIPSKAHKTLPQIRKGHFNRRLVILKGLLEEFKIPKASIDTWISFEKSFEQSITS